MSIQRSLNKNPIYIDWSKIEGGAALSKLLGSDPSTRSININENYDHQMLHNRALKMLRLRALCSLPSYEIIESPVTLHSYLRDKGTWTKNPIVKTDHIVQTVVREKIFQTDRLPTFSGPKIDEMD